MHSQIRPDVYLTNANVTAGADTMATGATTDAVRNGKADFTAAGKGFRTLRTKPIVAIQNQCNIQNEDLNNRWSVQYRLVVKLR